MNKTFFVIAILILVTLAAGTGYYFYAYRPYETSGRMPPPSEPIPTDMTPEPLQESDELVTYFLDRIIALGIADIGQPIEGFDAALLMLAFPGMQKSDFANVETLEGYYELKEDVLDFVRTQTLPVSTAERTVSKKGYATLLKNLSGRLGVKAESKESIDGLIAGLNTAETIKVGINQEGNALNITIVPLTVLEDSRCPVDVQCIQAGTVRLRARISSGLGTSEQVFTLGMPTTTEAEEVTLTRVEPQTHSKTPIKPAEYLFYFTVKKR